MNPNPYQHLPYQCRPRGNAADPRIMGFDRATALFTDSPDYAMRRVAVMHHPDVLYALIESGASRNDIATALGFSNWPQLRFWLYDRNMLDAFTATYRDAADLFYGASIGMELLDTGYTHPSLSFTADYYGRYTPTELCRMAGRNNPGKYTPAGKLKATPAPPADTPRTSRPAFSTAKFTGAWNPSLAA